MVDTFADIVDILEISQLPGRRGKSPQDIFEWLSPSHWEVIGQLSSHRHRHFDGTLQWLYLSPELKAWLGGKDAPNVLWLTGFPGVGKSIIAAHLLSNLHAQLCSDRAIERQRQVYISYFFCKEGEQKLTQAQSLLQTFSYQLALQSQRFLCELDRTRREERFVCSSAAGIRLLYNRLFQQPLSSLLAVRESDIVYCIIDGLDEADFDVADRRYGESDIIVLLKLLATNPQIRILVLSRSIPQIREAMLSLNSTTKDINAVENGNDIELYVAWKIAQSAKLRDGFRRSGLDINPVIHLKNSANGNFLWVDILLKYLEGSSSIKEFNTGLLEAPAQFHELYKRLLRRLAATCSQGTRLIVREVIRMVVTSSRELNVEELQAAVEATLDDQFFDFVGLLNSECGTFLRLVDDPGDFGKKQVQIVHETFRVFITSDASQGEEFHVSLPEAHGEITCVLLRYLSENDFGERITSGTFTQWSEDATSRTNDKYPLLKYAASKWSFHFRRSLGSQRIVERLYESVLKFIQHGPLLNWVEALAIFQDLTALSTTSEDIRFWTASHSFSLPDSVVDLLNGWAREIAHLLTEYVNILIDHPNSIHDMLFDLFPEPSIFHRRFSNRRASFSEGFSMPWNPAFVVNYDQSYDVSAISPEQKLVALASIAEIRILDQTHGQTVQLLRHPENRKWAVLAMCFSPKKNMFAAVYCPLAATEAVRYCPHLSVWDVEKRTLLVTVSLDLHIDNTICLVDQITFSKDARCILGGGWKYDLMQKEANTDWLQEAQMNFKDAEAVVFSPNGRSVLRFGARGERDLIQLDAAKIVAFSKPPYYLSDDDNPSNLPYAKEAHNGPRFIVAPFLWWQLWRELTRTYRFSPDSRWFARFTEKYDVVLHDLDKNTERTIYQPVGPIMPNNLAFDSLSERLAWTFDHVGVNNGSDTSVEFWGTQTMSPVAGFQLGRRYRERVEFCSDNDHLLLYRADVSLWDIPLALQSQGEQSKTRFEESNIRGYAPGVMRIGYTVNGAVFVNYRGESISGDVGVGNGPLAMIYEGGWAGLWQFAELWGWGLPRPSGDSMTGCGPWCEVRHGPQCRPLLVTQVFKNTRKIYGRVSHETSCAYSLHRYPPACERDDLVMGDTILDISDSNNPTVRQMISLDRTGGLTVLSTAFHLTSGLMAYLGGQPTTETGSFHKFDLVLQVHCIVNNRLFTSTTFSPNINLSSQMRYMGPFVLFDPSPSPSYLIVLLLETVRAEQSSGNEGTSSEDYGGLHIWIFHYPSLIQTKSFKVPNNDPCKIQNDRVTTLNCYFDSGLKKLICCEERRVPVNICCQLWIVDIEKESGTIQYLPEFRRLDFVQSLDIVVAMHLRGWIQCKKINDMEEEMRQHGGDKISFNDPWVLEGWKKLVYVPRKFSPCFESGIAVHKSGRVAFVAEFANRLVEISFDW